MRRWTDPREHQQLRRIDRAAAQHHLTPRLKGSTLSRLLDLDAAGPPAIEEDAARQVSDSTVRLGRLSTG
jgi:hypothetical protein